MAALLPGVDIRWGWQPTDTGLAVYGQPAEFDASSRPDWCPPEWVLDGPSDEPNGKGGYFRCVNPETDDAPFEFGAGLVIGSAVAAEYTWADLGLESYADLVSTTMQMFFSADGSTFEAVAIPQVDGGINGSIELVATETEFLAAVAWYTTSSSAVADFALLRSDDGRLWAATAPPASGGGYPTAIGAIGDRIVWVSTDSAGRSVIESTADGTTWDTVDVSALTDGLTDPRFEATDVQVWIERAAVGSGGAAVVLTVVEATPEPGIATTTIVVGDGDVSVAPGTQALPSTTSIGFVDGPGRPAPPATTLGTVTTVEIMSAPTISVGTAPPPEGPSLSAIRRIVLHSLDGVTWLATPMEDITATPILQVNSLFITGSSVRMIVQPAQAPGDPALSSQLVLVGEPKA
jgi:hypothetical protein